MVGVGNDCILGTDWLLVESRERAGVSVGAAGCIEGLYVLPRTEDTNGLAGGVVFPRVASALAFSSSDVF